MKIIVCISCCLLFSVMSFAQTTNDLLNLLVLNKTITQQQADSIRAEDANLQQQINASRKSFFISAGKQMSLTGYTQFRYQDFQEKGKNDGFDIRRARLDLKGSITPYFSYRIQTDLADKPKIIDAYGEIKIADFFMITGGQFKIPFSLENLTSSNKLEFIDRSQVVEALVARSKDVIGNQNGRDIGVQVSGFLFRINDLQLLEYRLGVFNGSGINVADTANSAKDLSGRIVLTPFKGFAFGGSFYSGWDKAIKPDVTGKSQVRNRIGFEASYTTSRLSIKGEYISGRDGKTSRDGGYLQATYYVLAQKLQLGVKYDIYDPSTSVSNNITTNYIIGGTFYFTTWSRLQAFYVIRSEQGTQVPNNLLTIQYQIGF